MNFNKREAAIETLVVCSVLILFLMRMYEILNSTT